jgi:hypothetical protein
MDDSVMQEVTSNRANCTKPHLGPEEKREFCTLIARRLFASRDGQCSPSPRQVQSISGAGVKAPNCLPYAAVARITCGGGVVSWAADRAERGGCKVDLTGRVVLEV